MSGWVETHADDCLKRGLSCSCSSCHGNLIRAIRETIEEAARRCREVADEAVALDKADGVSPGSIRGLSQPAYLSAALFCAEAIEAMLVDDPQAKGGAR